MLAGEALVGNDAKGIHVVLRRRVAPLEHLDRCICRRQGAQLARIEKGTVLAIVIAHGVDVDRSLILYDVVRLAGRSTCDTEIEDLRCALISEEDVAGFEVGMDKRWRLRVRVGKRGGDVTNDVARLLRLQAFAVLLQVGV